MASNFSIPTGFPDASNTGIPVGTTLKASGSLVITTPGTVINALDVKGQIEILAPNVTIQNSRITTTDWTAIWIKPGVTGTVIKDSEISNYGSGVNQSNGIAGEGTFLRNDIFHIENGINVFGPSLIQGNYIHDMQASGAPHYDGIEINGGHDIAIRGNTVINDNSQTSAVMINNDFSPVSNILVDGNFLAGGGYTVYSDSRFDGGPTTGVQFTNNVMGEGYWGYAAFWNNTPAWSGNIDLGTYRYVSSGGVLGVSAPPPDQPPPDPDPDPTPSPPDTTHAGDDVYTVPGDTVNEQPGQGIDKVESSVNYTLPANVEKLQLMGNSPITGTGNSLDNEIIGNDAANVIKGGAGNDALNGWGGKDTFYGESGNDTFKFTSQFSANGDKVMDFVHGVDKIDLSKIDASSGQSGDQSFIFDGYSDGGSTRHVWLVEDRAAGVTDLYARTSTFQFQIEIKGTGLGLSAADFIL